MKIYTKTGDKGKTSLMDGTRVYKHNPRVEAYGTVDELNAVIGIVFTQLTITNYQLRMKEVLIRIQNDLFEIGSNLADPKAIENEKLQKQLEQHTKDLEKYIDELTLAMPELTYFILPGGGKVGAFLHLARTVSRRAERNIVSLSQTEHVTKEVLVYVNRLSDVFHTMSRYSNFMEKKQETIWVSTTK
jgi:cob(I)alamin adenosyltransferase